MFTPAQLAAAINADTAVVVHDYPYGFRLRCMMRAWVEFKKGHGFRYVTQTTNPKLGRWNKPKAGTYSRVCMAIGVDENGHLYADSLTEYSNLSEYAAFRAKHEPALSPHALASLTFWTDVKQAYENECAKLDVHNVYNATPEQARQIRAAAHMACARHVKAGTDY